MTKLYYEILRETSKYNKYMKWHLNIYREDKTLLSSQYFKTHQEAVKHIEDAIYQGENGFPIGNRIYYSSYFCIGA